MKYIDLIINTLVTTLRIIGVFGVFIFSFTIFYILYVGLINIHLYI